MARPIAIVPNEKVIAREIGAIYNSLTIVSFSHRKSGMFYYTCQCDCGKGTVVCISYLRSGHTKSCGCLKNDRSLWRDRDGNKLTSFDDTHKRLFRIWRGMIYRCEKETDKNFKRYGLRGIKVCDEWKDFDVFKEWALSSSYKNDLSIERKDNDGNYCVENCTWETTKAQANNRRSNVFIEHNGEKLSLAVWSLRLGTNPSLVWSRIHQLGWDETKAITTPK